LAGKKVVTQKTISEKLHISVMAVSRALRDDPRISDETKRKVKAMAQELDYRPNSIAKSLRMNETKTLGLVIADSSLSVFAGLINGVEDAAKKLGYNIILSSAHSSVELEMEAVRILVSKRIDGLLLAASTLTSGKYKGFLDSMDVPYVFLMRRCEYEDGNYVVPDNTNIIAQMVNYLVKTGSRRIHFLNLSKSIISAYDREEGYREALKGNGIAFDQSLVYYLRPEIDAGYAQMTQILDAGETVDAVFCGCDMIAVGAMESILEHGYNIPDDIRIAAHDDIQLSAYLRVPLTTIRAQRYKTGKMGTELLVEKIKTTPDLCIRRILKSELVLRKST
jgi:DNA-binding LacI/PurR family transcriptional regulator